MKKVTAILMTAAIAVVFSAQAWSQNTGPAPEKSATLKSQQQTKPAQAGFVDKNNNGICDNYEARGSGGKGKNFVDKDGDGKCDNCQGNCNGQGKGKGNCCGKGPGYGKQAGQGNCGGGQGHRHRHGCQGNVQAPAKPSSDTGEKK